MGVIIRREPHCPMSVDSTTGMVEASSSPGLCRYRGTAFPNSCSSVVPNSKTSCPRILLLVRRWYGAMPATFQMMTEVVLAALWMTDESTMFSVTAMTVAFSTITLLMTPMLVAFGQRFIG